MQLGDDVQVKQLVALLNHPDTPQRQPTEILEKGQGVVLCKRFPALTQRGDCPYQLAAPI